MLPYQEATYRTDCFNALQRTFKAFRDTSSPTVVVGESFSLDDYISRFTPRYQFALEMWGRETFDFLTTPQKVLEKYAEDYGLNPSEKQEVKERFNTYVFADDPDFQASYFKARKRSFQVATHHPLEVIRKSPNLTLDIEDDTLQDRLQACLSYSSFEDAVANLRWVESKYSEVHQFQFGNLFSIDGWESIARGRSLIRELTSQLTSASVQVYQNLGRVGDEYRILLGESKK